MVERIGLVGAAGAVGRSMSRALVARGKPFRVIGRSAYLARGELRRDARADRVTWNPEQPSSVRAAVRGLDTLVYLVACRTTASSQHPVVMRQTLEGAIAEGVQRLVLVGTVYPYGLPRTTRSPRTIRASRTPSRAGCARPGGPASPGRRGGEDPRRRAPAPDFYGPASRRACFTTRSSPRSRAGRRTSSAHRHATRVRLRSGRRAGAARPRRPAGGLRSLVAPGRTGDNHPA
jgi:hypothetical protein